MINFLSRNINFFYYKIALFDNIEENKTNLRNSKKHMEWRRNKVREMLTRGYAQYEIANILHISQPTISRDIHYIEMEILKRKIDPDLEVLESYRSAVLGLNELIKKLWEIIDSSKTETKEKNKAISLMSLIFKQRSEILSNEASLIHSRKVEKIFGKFP